MSTFGRILRALAAHPRNARDLLREWFPRTTEFSLERQLNGEKMMLAFAAAWRREPTEFRIRDAALDRILAEPSPNSVATLPTLFLRPAIIEASNGRSVLFDDVTCLATMMVGNTLYIQGMHADNRLDGTAVEIEIDRVLYTDEQDMAAWGSISFAWLLALGTLCDDATTPLRIETLSKPGKGRLAKISPHIRRRNIYLDERPIIAIPILPTETKCPGKLDHLPTVETTVRGHYRMQPCGPGRTQVRLIFIESFARKQRRTPEVVSQTVVDHRPPRDPSSPIVESVRRST
jgi:hypothetical protein